MTLLQSKVFYMALAGSLMFSGAAMADTAAPSSPVPPAQSVPVPTPPAPVAVVPAKTETAPTDPCEGFKTSEDAYVICQDRMKKIEAMMNARTQRTLRAEVSAGREKVDAPYPAATQPAAPQTPAPATPAAPTAGK